MFLNSDILCEVCLFLTIPSIHKLSLCNKELAQIIHNNDWLWKQLFDIHCITQLKHLDMFERTLAPLPSHVTVDHDTTAVPTTTLSWREKFKASRCCKFVAFAHVRNTLPGSDASPSNSYSPPLGSSPMRDMMERYNKQLEQQRIAIHASVASLLDPFLLQQLEFSSINMYHSLLEYSNEGRTVLNTNEYATKWTTVPCAQTLCPGYIYQWSILVDNIEDCNNNYWKVIVGVIPHPGKTAQLVDRNSARSRKRANGIWISSEGADGIGLILSSNRIIYKGNDFYKLGDEYTISNGDVVTVRFDMTNSSEDNDEILLDDDNYVSVATKNYQEMRKDLIGESRVGANIMFYVNGRAVMDEPFDFLDGQLFYPAVSLINKQKTSILSFVKYEPESD